MKITLARLKKIPSNKILKTWIEWLNNKKVSNYSARSSKKHSINSQKQFLKKKILFEKSYLFKINFNKEFVGVVELVNIDFLFKNCEIRYLVGNTNFWNKGIATNAIKLATQFCFEKLKLKLVIADTHEDNIASQKVLRKNNFDLHGKIKKFFNNKKVSKDKLIFAKFKK